MNEELEIFDVVDENDCVLFQASRQKVHKNGWLHRSVHILVFNSEGKLFLQKRSQNKDENPGYWDTSAAGHVNAGEDYLTCAKRELGEELGIQEELEFINGITARPETFGEHVKTYLCKTEKKITINPLEIDEGKYWDLDEISQALKNSNLLFTSTFRLIFEHYKNYKR